MPDAGGFTQTDSGLQYQDSGRGTGAEATNGQIATIHYTGNLLEDGTEFDTSVGQVPFSLSMGAGGVDPGLRGRRNAA